MSDKTFSWKIDRFKKIIVKSKNIEEAAKLLGYNPGSSVYLAVLADIKDMELDTSHWD